MSLQYKMSIHFWHNQEKSEELGGKEREKEHKQQGEKEREKEREKVEKITQAIIIE